MLKGKKGNIKKLAYFAVGPFEAGFTAALWGWFADTGPRVTVDCPVTMVTHG